MAKRVEDQDGLTPQEAKACLYRVQGLDQTEAYRRAFDVGRQSQKTSTEKASRLFARGKLQARIQALLDAARVSDLLSAGVWLDQLKADVATARAAGNFNAVMNGTRLLGQALGVLRDNVNVTVERRASDNELIALLAKDNPDLAAALRKNMGAPDGFEETRH
jgi:hypothetical protein